MVRHNSFGHVELILRCPPPALTCRYSRGMSAHPTAYLVLAYLIVTDGAGAVFFIQGDGNDLAIALPLLAPPVLAGLLLAADALV